ncbi:hypothetical protein, unlikely [Trypanosoma brucei gambiense DAL972]|uniref:Uncharacterized protein n=1 Tax=Trypanosoma brucei gambiense (strain MHOM/CI/86/DAL972) TaxID=679716 RepID=C9ZNN5_TRYB9|nr:hypothetical protein, unlikely [Trypanosoma brucei gambiense DAL972]CBH11013.1 hypothetical protein, unlikely [Trypanosoma brucei gambiense DAL972]|eukprot:XP_011773300.1 hypothetical protein, unlikely [Trypanosoma brucei gambiense DAL972]
MVLSKIEVNNKSNGQTNKRINKTNIRAGKYTFRFKHTPYFRFFFCCCLPSYLASFLSPLLFFFKFPSLSHHLDSWEKQQQQQFDTIYNYMRRPTVKMPPFFFAAA